MTGRWRGLHRDLYVMLSAIFLAGAAVVTFGLMAVYDLFEDGIDSIEMVAIEHYLRDFLAHVPDAPAQAELESLMENQPFDLGVTGPHWTWASSGRFDHQLGLGDEHHHSGDISIGMVLFRAFARVKRGDYTYVFVAPKMDQSMIQERYLGLLVILICILTFIFGFFAVRRLFRPIDWVKSGATRIGNGELSYRLPSSSIVQMNELVVAINTMASDLERLLDAKRHLLLAISHELRSPLTRAKVSLEFVEQPDLKADLSHDLGEMERMVTALLETERLNSRHAALQWEWVPLADFLREVAEEAGGVHAHRIVAELPQGEHLVRLDPVRMRLLLSNLLDNALRYSREAVHVMAEMFPCQWKLRVSDTGPGIAPEHLPALTEPFYRVDPSRQRKTGGFGLGLYLCRLIAEAHGGSLTVESDVGQGTCVVAEFPIQDEGLAKGSQPVG